MQSRGLGLTPFPTRSAWARDDALAAAFVQEPPGRRMLAALKLHQVRYVLGAAEHGSFRRAADALNIRQSTVSRRIRELEDRLGASLFDRDTRGVRLTEAGDLFLQGAQRAMMQLGLAVGHAGALGQVEQGEVRIGLLSPLTPGFLDDLLRAALARDPRLRLTICEGGSRDHMAALKAGRLDIAVLAGQPTLPHYAVKPLWRERMVLALPSGHGLASRARVDWTDLAGERLLLPDGDAGREIEAFLDRRLRRRGCEATILRQAASRDTLLHLVGLGQGISIAPASVSRAARTDVVYRPITRAMLSFSALWSPRNPKSAVHRLLALAATHPGGTAPDSA